MIRRLATLTALLSATLPVVPSATADPPDPDPYVVRTDAGQLRGAPDGDVVRFSGVPYALPPTGDRRWTAPSPPRPWPGVRDATSPSPRCPQLGYDEEFKQVVVGAEDCLHLDVVAPIRPHRGRLPVVVWLHGGNLTAGGAAEYDGARLATGGDLVVVTVNYRLGALGFLPTSALDTGRSVSGNYGLLDQAEALRWVRRNIGAFGGDPRRITLAGQSAGARSVCSHLASPGSRRLFQRAIVQSGACANPVVRKRVADRRGADVVERLGCTAVAPADTATCLRRLPATDLVDKLAGQPPITGERRDDPWGPVAGTPYLPRQPIDALRRGSAAGMPLLLGSTRDEMRGLVLGRVPDLTTAGYDDAVRTAFGKNAEEVLRGYPVHDFATPALALATVLTDWGGGIGSCPVLATARTAARHAPVYAYELREDSRQYQGDVSYGAYHGWDLPFLWDTDIPFSQYPDLEEMTAPQRRLSRAMIGYWSRFAHRGDPNRPGLPHWRAARPTSSSVLGLEADAIGRTPFAAEHRCGFWDRL